MTRSNWICVLALVALCTVGVAAAEGIAGAWKFVLDTPGGIRITNADFVLDGENISGQWGKDNAKGTFKEGQLHLEFPLFSDEAGSSGTMIVDGKLEGAKLTGKWQWSQYGGTFVASRPE
jgi:hypothetical protein